MVSASIDRADPQGLATLEPVRSLTVDRVPLHLYRWTDGQALAEVRAAVLAREAEILSLPRSAEWSARHDHVASSRYASYNLLALEEPAFAMLGKAIRASVNALRAARGLPEKPMYIQCWSNILRAGQALPRHAHPYPMHGHINISTAGSVTRYGVSEPVEIDNRPGDITLFAGPGLAHEVPAYTGPDARISVAFDLLPVVWVEADPRWKKRHAERSFIPF
ncbi:hypothetical protein [Stappia sp. ES.058]|uniref:hypothetical protein n=1 Tax=Stappia sp. ES.058 TaxID=1881061 RepID=UPI00087BBA66|nr:hypothetical protein [Stappia sp. ES.058]SDU31186.1 hypothetical protein SAMN05428979_2903 [Stappia sp. ES.058]